MNQRQLKNPHFALFIFCFLFSIAFLAFSVFNAAKAHRTYASAPTTSAESMAVLEVSTRRVLYQKDMHRRGEPASTTKILTAITVIENTPDLDAVRTVPDAAVGVEGSSIYLAHGEKLSVRDLLYGLMLQSGNDCAEALAILTCGSKEKFAEKMNETARKIGAKSSNFVTPHGLDAPEHYTTAYDLALISAYALTNRDFQEIVRTKKHSAPWAGHDYNRVIVNKNKLLNSFEGCDGVKTGFTKRAGRCYVGSATREGMQVVCSVLNCGPMFEDSAALMESAFSEFKMTEVVKKGEPLARLPILEGKKEFVNLGAGGTVRYPLREGELEKLHFNARCVVPLKAPVAIGKESGEIQVILQNDLLFSTPLYTIESAESLSLCDRLRDIANQWTA